MPETPSTTIAPLAGKTTIDDRMFFDPERLSYESAVLIAKRIASRVGEKVKGKIVVIAGTRLLADFANLQAVYVVLDSLLRDYESIGTAAQSLVQRKSSVQRKSQVEEVLEVFVRPGAGLVAGAVASVISPATAAVGAALGLVSFFRQDVEYHGEKTLLDSLAFEIALAAEVGVAGTTKAYVPDLVVLPALDTGKSLFQTRMNQVQQAKAGAWAAVAPLISQMLRFEGELDQASKSKDQKAVDRLSMEISSMRRDMAPVSDPLGRLDQRLSDFENQMNQTEPTSGLLVLARLLRAEALQARKPLYLHATVVSSGGYYRVTRNLFRTLFFGDGLSFAGGATVRWALLADDGAVATGGIDVTALKGKFGLGSYRFNEEQVLRLTKPNAMPAPDEDTNSGKNE
jgi:hypothetical protein